MEEIAKQELKEKMDDLILSLKNNMQGYYVKINEIKYKQLKNDVLKEIGCDMFEEEITDNVGIFQGKILDAEFQILKLNKWKNELKVMNKNASSYV
jgi:hypothetical protein|tara:strand:+ start:1442 stop:1729 length:288 start_codon:yes stop_codon:yes gene_type:complete